MLFKVAVLGSDSIDLKQRGQVLDLKQRGQVLQSHKTTGSKQRGQVLQSHIFSKDISQINGLKLD